MKTMKYIIIALAMLLLCSSIAGATKVVRSGDEIKLYTDAGVYKNHVVLPGLLDYEFKNNVLYTITASKFTTFNVANPSTIIQTMLFQGNYWDIDLVSGTTSGSVFVASERGCQQYFIKSSDSWRKPVLKAVYQPGLTIKTVVADSGGVKLYALNGQKFQYLWKSDGYLIITDAWL